MRRLHHALAARIQAARIHRDRGSHTTEWILGIVIVVAISGAVGAILVPTFTEAASSIDLGVTE